MKKVLCLLLAVLMIAGAVPVNAIAFELERVGESVSGEEEVADISDTEEIISLEGIEEEAETLLSTKTEAMETGVYQKILEVQEEMKKVLPNGYWSEDGKKHSNGRDYGYLKTMVEDVFKYDDWVKKGYLTSGQYDCWSCYAFARFVFVKVFGSFKNKNEPISANTYPANKASSYNKLKTGDMIYTGTHCMIYLWHDDAGVTVMDGNGDGNATINYAKKYSYNHGNLNGYLEVYRANNWDEIDKKYGHSYDKYGYCSHCGKYYEEINKVTSIDGTLTSTEKVKVKPHPYTGDEGVYQDRPGKGPYKIIGKIENHYGKTWYKISYGSSKTGWVYPEENVTIDINNTLTFDLYMNTYSIPKGSSVWANDSSAKYNWYGKVSSSNGVSKITSVTFEILKPDGTLTSSSNRITKKPNAASYTVKTADDTMKFSELAVGEYILSLKATDEYGETGSRQVSFSIVNSSSSNVPVKGVSLNYETKDMDIGDIVQLTATVTPSNATNKAVTWSSSNTSVATVSSSGVVTAVSDGNAVITVTTKDGGYKDTCSVTVNPAFCTVHFDVGGGYFEYSDVHVPEGSSFTIPEEIPVRSGYSFKGWQTTDSAEGEWTKTKPSAGEYETGYKYYTWGYEHNSDYTYLYGDDKDELIEHIKKNSGTFGSYNPKKMRYFYLIESSDKGSSYYPGKSGSNYNYFNVDYISEDGKTGTVRIYKTVFYFESKVYKQDAAVTVIYQPGDSIVVDKDITLTAIWEEEPPTITVESIEIFSGSAAELNIIIENNDAADNLSFDLDLIYDKNAFEVTYVETFFPEDGVVEVNGDNIKYDVVDGKSYSFSGLFLSVILNAKNIEAKDYNFSIDVNKWVNGFGSVEPKVVDGTIHVLNQTYSVTFDPGKGTGGPDDITVTGNEFTVPTEIPVCENWNFIFWMAQDGKSYHPGKTYTITEDLDLIAIFEPGWIPEISVENIKGKPGEAVEILVTVKNNAESPDLYSFVTVMEPYGDYVSNLIFTPSGKNLPKNGIMGKFTFDIPKDAKIGTVYTISMIFDEWVVGGFDMASSEMLKFTNGSITVEEPEKATYTVTYDANGGSGAPSAQTKTEGEALTLSSVKPVREGYEFLGWATSKTASKAEYQPGSSYTKDANVTLYAVWKQKEVIPEDAPTIVIGEVSGKAGETVEVPVVLKNNPGFAGADLKIEYDKDVLELTEIRLNLFPENNMASTTSGKISGGGSEDITDDGEMFTAVFKIKDTAKEGSSEIGLVFYECYNIDDEEVIFNISKGKVTVCDYIRGDANGDGKVSSRDITRILQYLVDELGDKTIDLKAADFNGDGKVSSRDITAILKYLVE